MRPTPADIELKKKFDKALEGKSTKVILCVCSIASPLMSIIPKMPENHAIEVQFEIGAGNKTFTRQVIETLSEILVAVSPRCGNRTIRLARSGNAISIEVTRD